METNREIEEKEFNRRDALWPFIKRLFGMAKQRYPRLYWSLVVAVLLVAVADATLPVIWMKFIDGVLSPTLQEIQQSQASGVAYTLPFALFVPAIIQFSTWVVVMALGVLVFVWCAENIKERIIFDLRQMMFDKLQHLSYSFYDKNSTGWLVSRITSDADRVTELISWGFVSVIWGLSMVFFSFVYMFYYNWKLALGVLIIMPFLLYVSMKIRLIILKYSRKARKQNSEMIAYVTEHINGVAVNKATVQENAAIEGYGVQTKKMHEYAFKSSLYSALYVPLIFLFGAVAAAYVIKSGGSMVLLGSISVGVWAAFFSYSRNIFEPIFDIARFYALAQDSLSAGERIFSLIDETVSIKDEGKMQDFGSIQGEIEFQDLTFYYKEDKGILKNFNLHIKAGESVALVGPTGHGKTTLTALIGRFYEPVSGKLLIDGVDYRSRSLHSFREQLGVILQSPYLFSGTLRSNILFSLRGSKEKMPGDEELKAMLVGLGAADLANKLDVEVGEEGGNLSSGERQLVSFARAVVKNPAILIMDEATSSVDTLTEAIIQQGIGKIIKNRTSIIIAHRLSTIKLCDKIVVIEHGKIKEMGNHEELIAMKGHYYDLYKMQARRKAVV